LIFLDLPIIVGEVAKLAYDILLKHIGANLSLIAAIIIEAAVYFVIIYLMKIDEVKNKFRRSAENE